MKIANNCVAVVGLLVLTALAFELNELSRHFFGWIVCGRPGSVTFTQLAAAEGCAVGRTRLVELCGPLLSMALAYAGAGWVMKRGSLFGFGLAFASCFHLRFLPALMGAGSDEVDLVRQTGWLHGSPYAVAAILFVLALPPLLEAGRALEGGWRWPAFALAYLLPLPILGLADRFDVLFTGLHPNVPFLAAGTWLNIPAIVLAVDLALTIAFALIAKSLDPSALIVRLNPVEWPAPRAGWRREPRAVAGNRGQGWGPRGAHGKPRGR